MDWPFTGRAAELDLFAGLLTPDVTPRGLAVVGAPGVGKTRLIQEAAGLAARRGWTVHQVAGTGVGQRIPLGAFADWLDRIDEQPLNLVNDVIAAVLGADAGPMLVTVDDAHLLDDLSAFVLYKLMVRGGDAVRVILTLRSGVQPSDTLAGLWKDGHLRRLDLTPLSQADSGALIETAVGGPVDPAAAERIWEMTHGNVLFLRQLVQQELDAGRLIRSTANVWQWNGPLTVSPTLAELVQADIGAASPEVLDVIDLTALAEPLEMIHLTAMADPAAIEEAERRGLITVHSDSTTPRARISYPLYAETRRAVMGQMRSMRLRGRIAEAIAANRPGAGTADPVQLGLLWLESDLQPNPELVYEAAAQAFRRFDIPLTQRLTEAAIRAGAGTEAQVLHARILALLGRPGEAEETLESAVVGENPDAVWATATCLRAINELLALGHPDESWATIDAALSHSPDGVVDLLRAVRALQLAMAAQPSEVMALAEAIDRDRLELKAKVNLNFGVSLAMGELGYPGLATEAPEDAMVLAANPPVNSYEVLTLAIIHADALLINGSISAARSLGDRLDGRWLGLPVAPHVISNALDGMVALGRGDLTTACSLLDTVLSRPELHREQQGQPFLGVGYWLSILHTEALARAGRTAKALAAMETMQRIKHPAYVFLEPNRLIAQAWVAAARGRITEALKLVAEAADFARGHGQRAREVLALQAALQFGDNGSRDRLIELASQMDAPRAGLVTRWATARAAGDGPALLGVSEDLEVMGDRIAAADAAAQAARIFEAANLRGARLTASTRASRLAADCGAVTPATNQAATPLPLTSREREVAALVREGLSNKEIAENLTMSVRTVEGHIYRACTKLGLESRTELAALMN